MTESVFFQDLAVVMAIAGLAALVCSRLHWPKVFGYIAVGILMNGHTWGGAFLADVTSINTISQLGIVFLMLTMGLEFSTSDMKRIKGVVLPTALIDTAVMTWLGYMVGTRILGWKLVPSMFLGVAICDSATTLLAKMIGELGWSRRPFVKNVIGTSVCEDLICVGLIALVTGVAHGSGMSLTAVGFSLGGLAMFILSTIVIGLILVPRLFKSVGRRKDDETLLLTLLGLCFFISWVAYKFDYSLAIGAFLVGLMGASSELRNRLHALIAPLRSMFSAMFFVSIGLLVNPSACWENLGTILLVMLVVVAGKSVNCFCGAILTGATVKTAVQMALSLAQIGEFAFMVALMYVSISGDALSPMFQVAVGVSLLTTLLNPFLIRLSDPLGTWAERTCPKRIAGWLRAYGAFLAKYHAVESSNRDRRRVRLCLIEMTVIAVLEFALAAVFGLLSIVDWSRFSVTFEKYDMHVFTLLVNLFMVAMVAPLWKIATVLVEALNGILVGPGDARWQPPVRGLVGAFTRVAVFGAFLVEMVMVNAAAMPRNSPVFQLSLLVTMVVVGVVGWRFFRRMGVRAKQRFDEALEVDKRLADLGTMLTIEVPEDVINALTIGPDSPAIGGTVVSLNIRAKTGASVVSVRRGNVDTRNIGPDWTFRAGDTLVAIGEPEQIAALRKLLEVKEPDGER